jgi:HSP20 family protein
MSARNLEIWMWGEACDMLRQADRMHRHFFRPAIVNVRQSTWEPPIDVYETQCDFNILIALPGVVPEHLHIVLEDKLLVIYGRRHLPFGPESHIHRLEIPYGCFERRIELPSANCEIDRREFINGCLLITLRKL